MKAIKELIKYSFIIIFLSSSSCDGSDEQEIPTGNHSFYCYIDGDLFVPKGNPNITTSPSNDGLALLQYDSFFQADVKDFEKYVVMFNISNWTEGIFNLSESDGDFYNHSINHAMIKIDDIWYLSKENSGNVIFSEADIEGNTYGTFEFTLYNENDENDTIQITSGHFDD